MKKLLNVEHAIKIAHKLKQKGKSIVLAGGCFDILHIGHVLFLKAAKREGDALFLLLESDENIIKRKGKGRPVNALENRAIILSAIESVDYIIPLVGVTKDGEYDRLMVKIKPDVIAMTQGDPQIRQRARQAKLVGAKLKLVINKVENKSTTALISQIRN